MYEQFFQLQRRPFAATPDPACFFSSEPTAELLNQLTVCVEHGQGIGDLLDAVVARLPAVSVAAPAMAEESEAAAEPAIAVVGRPNVGKSSLVNRLLREDRVMVSPTPGTTRDVVDEVLRWHRRQFRIADTAGIRRPGRVAESGKVESVSVVRARHAMEQADVAVLVVDAVAGVGRRDASIAGEAAGAGCGLIIAANKWDLVADAAERERQIRDRLSISLPQVKGVPLVRLSALTGAGVSDLLPAVLRAHGLWTSRLDTGPLNRWLASAAQRHPPPSPSGRRIRLRYITQAGTRPPRFVVFGTRLDMLPKSYERYLVNGIRDKLGFDAVPVRVVLKSPKNPYQKD